jgi:hypothetical protein
LPDHWHAILFPPYPLTISRVMEAIKVGSTHRINAGRGGAGFALTLLLFPANLGKMGAGVRR